MIGGYDETPVGAIVINGGSVNATGVYWGAGIGGGDDMPIASVTINGGIVKAESDRSAGIGNGGAGEGGTITITGGTINAASEFACGIGGGYIADIGSVVITGGDITATSESGAGIGSCAYQTTAEVTISGGIVTATSNSGDGIGMGDIFRDDLVDFSTATNGHAVIFASSIADQTSKDSWSGLIFVDNNGKIYGDSYTVDGDLTIPSDKILTIENGKTLIIPDGVNFDFAGEIRLDEGGKYTGTLPFGSTLTYQIQWDTDCDGTVDDTTYVAYGEIPDHEEGSKESTVDTVYTFTDWSPEIKAVTGTATYKAQFSSSTRTYTVTVPTTGEGYTIRYTGNTEVAYNSDFTFTVDIGRGYYKTSAFAVQANGQALNANADGIYTVHVLDNTEITITGVAKESALAAPVIDSGKYDFNWTADNVTLTPSATSDSGIAYYEYSTNGGDSWMKLTGDSLTITESGFATEYIFRAVSNAGNISPSSEPVTVKIDRAAPDGDIKFEKDSVKEFISNITFGLFFNKDIDAEITGTDDLSGVKKIEYYRSDKALTEAEVTAITDWTETNGKFSVTAEDKAKFIYYVKITDEAGNSAYFGSDGATFDLTAPVISGITNGAEYYATQSVTISDANLQSVTLNDKNVGDTFTLTGNKETVYTIVAADKAGNKTTFTVTMKTIASMEEPIDGLTADNVTSEDKEAVEMVKKQVGSIDLEDATEEEKATLQEILDKCDALIDKINESVQAGNTEIIDKVENITPDNVKPEDKDDLTAAKEDLENALENFGDNYTEEEKAEIQNKLEQINNALESIEKVEKVQNAISKLPDTVEPDETDAEQFIHKAKNQYDALTEHEKSLISEELKEKLESLLGDLQDYRIIEGDGSKWIVGDDGSITMVANGSVEKFMGIEVDGKAVDSGNYTVKSGSTIISLKPEYLNTLSVGKHTLTVIYTDGEISGEFEIVKNAEASISETSDNSNIAFWIILMFIAACGSTGTMVYSRKKKYSK